MFFVITALLEFAIVLFLKRKGENATGRSRISALDCETKNGNRIYQMTISNADFEVVNGSSKRNIATGTNVNHTKIPLRSIKTCLCIHASPITRIDITMFWFFSMAYLIFNILYFYWCNFLLIQRGL